MSKLFYDHIILLHELHSEIESLSLENHHKIEIIQVIEETTHHRVLHLILDNLDEKDHQYFLEIYHQSPHNPALLKYLNSKIIGFETKLKDLWLEIKYQFLKDLRSHL